jgi:predicted transcriptional regulator
MTKFEITLPDSVASEIEDVARMTGLSRQELVSTAVERFLQDRARWHEDMTAATADADRAFGADGEDVLEWMDSWGTAQERERPLLRGELR